MVACFKIQKVGPVKKIHFVDNSQQKKRISQTDTWLTDTRDPRFPSADSATVLLLIGMSGSHWELGFIAPRLAVQS